MSFILKGFLTFVLITLVAGIAFMILYLILIIFDVEDKFLYLLRFHRHTDAFLNHEPCLTFEQFIAFYNVASEKWDIDLSEQIGYRQGIPTMWINFSTYGDCYKYNRWRKKEKERLRILKTNKQMSNFLNMVRKDSAEYEKRAYERANAVYDEILKNLNGEK